MHTTRLQNIRVLELKQLQKEEKICFVIFQNHTTNIQAKLRTNLIMLNILLKLILFFCVNRCSAVSEVVDIWSITWYPVESGFQSKTIAVKSQNQEFIRTPSFVV